MKKGCGRWGAADPLAFISIHRPAYRYNGIKIRDVQSPKLCYAPRASRGSLYVFRVPAGRIKRVYNNAHVHGPLSVYIYIGVPTI